MVICPPSLKAAIEDEPLAPAGVDPSTVPPELMRWWFAELFPWARVNAQRLKDGQDWCRKIETKPPDPG